jgi:hypothetical protein
MHYLFTIKIRCKIPSGDIFLKILSVHMIKGFNVKFQGKTLEQPDTVFGLGNIA